jgi:hypothetical protein
MPFILTFLLGWVTHVRGNVIFLSSLFHTWIFPSFEGVGWRMFGSIWTMLTQSFTLSWGNFTFIEEFT